VEIFEAAHRRRVLDFAAQLVGQLALRFDALEDGLLAFVELLEEVEPALDIADGILVETAGAFLAIAGDERDSVALVEELDDAFNLHLANLQILRDPRALERGCFIDHDGCPRTRGPSALGAIRQNNLPRTPANVQRTTL